MAAEGNILVIEDELQILRLLEITLNLNGHTVSEASTAREGIITAASQNPSLILPDPGLPVDDASLRLSCCDKLLALPSHIKKPA